MSDAAVPFDAIAAAPDVRDPESTAAPQDASPGAAGEPGVGPRILGMDPAVVERKRLAAEAWQRVVDAQGSGARLEGIVKRAIPGGLAVEIDGVAGFVPASQVRVPIGVDAASLVGSQQPLVVLDVDEKRRRAVVSQRRAVDARQREERAELFAQVRVGVVRSVKVVRLAPFGVFVEIGPGLDGLVPIGELALERVERIEDAAKVGDVFDAEIIRVEDRGKKIALSRKARSPIRGATRATSCASARPSRATSSARSPGCRSSSQRASSAWSARRMPILPGTRSARRSKSSSARPTGARGRST